jgi:hypothetical protein
VESAEEMWPSKVVYLGNNMKHRRGAEAVTHKSIEFPRDLGQDEKVGKGEM